MAVHRVLRSLCFSLLSSASALSRHVPVTLLASSLKHSALVFNGIEQPAHTKSMETTCV